ncbi:histidine kinase [Novosphingobium barchaimii]|nr:histidine kinase [Novosphingobium barchaimii]
MENGMSAASPVFSNRPFAAGAWLRAIIDSSADAIFSKTLDGVITSWNAGAKRLFGFTATEAIGQPITLIIPDDRRHEEEAILTRLRAGQRVERMETVRRTKTGELVQIEVSISPVCNDEHKVIGASTIARDISERLRHAEEQDLLVREMHHRIKNLLSVVQALVSVSRGRARSVDAFAEELTSRLAALATAQQLVLNQARDEAPTATLGEMLTILLAPYGDDQVAVAPCSCPVGEQAATSLALLFHELATNAAKYGGLSRADGRLAVTVNEDDARLVLYWRETGGCAPDEARAGFGSGLIEAALRGLRGTMSREWDGQALTTRLDLDRSAVAC